MTDDKTVYKIFNDTHYYIWIATFEKMINLDDEKVVSVIKIIDLNVKVFIKKIMVAFLLKINSGCIYITVLFQIVILKSNIWYFVTIIFLFVYYLVVVVFIDKYFWILYYKFW